MFLQILNASLLVEPGLLISQYVSVVEIPYLTFYCTIHLDFSKLLGKFCGKICILIGN